MRLLYHILLSTLLLSASKATADDITDFKKVDTLYRQARFEEALEAADHFIIRHPDSPLVPNALYIAGRLASSVAKALDNFSRIIVKYPGSSLVDNSLFMVAQYHYASEGYEEAAARFLLITEKYKTSDISDAAYWWLSRSYYALGDSVMARIWEERLAQKYPGSDYAKLPGPGVPDVAPAVARRYAIQVGSFSNEETASILRESLSKKGYDAYTTRSEASGEVLYRVRLGSFESREEAAILLKDLKEIEGLNGWITSASD